MTKPRIIMTVLGGCLLLVSQTASGLVPKPQTEPKAANCSPVAGIAKKAKAAKKTADKGGDKGDADAGKASGAKTKGNPTKAEAAKDIDDIMKK